MNRPDESVAQNVRLYQQRAISKALASAVVKGYDYNPGDSDLDDEQPIYVRMTLGDYRRASGVLYALREPGK